MSFSDITHTLPLEPIDTITNSNDHLKPISYLDINQNYFHSNYQHIKEDNIIQQRVASFNWNSHINSCANSTQSVVTAINDQPDIVIGDELLLDDSQTIRIGSEYLEKFVNHWKQFSNCILIRPNPFSSDIVQGLLGNCWFLSALALIAERSELLEKILLTTSQEFEKTKRATIRLFKQGRWHSVIVDNLLPVNKFGKLIFSQAKREQLFVPLIEKALAKLNGGYEALRGGLTSEGMTTLTGFPCEIVWLPNKQCIDNAHLKNGIVAIEQKEELWIKIVSYFTTGFLIGASCGRCSNTISFTEYRSIGLLEEHAYSVLDVYSKSDLRLIKLRNPWGTMVWKGDWSDTSLTWNDNLRKELIPEGAEEGIFWISFDDFCRYFEMIIVCKTQLGLHEYAFEGAIPGYTNDCLSNWIVYEISIDEQLTQEYYTQTQLTATLYQDKSNEPLAIFLVIYELLNSNTSPVIGSLVGFSICNAQSSVTVECDLRRNHRYLLGAFTFNNWYTEEDTYHPKKYIIRMQSMRQLLIKSFKPNSILLGDMIMHYARSVGSSIHRPNVVVYQLNTNWAGLVSVVENRDHHNWLLVSMNTTLKTSFQCDEEHNPSELINYKQRVVCSGGDNDHPKTIENTYKNSITNVPIKMKQDFNFLASTRNTLITKDLIPPGHCQLINVITNRRPIKSKQISIKLNFQFKSNQKLNEFYNNIERFHQPNIIDSTGFIYGFHCPRSIL